ncbi:hypothetical protein [Halococcus saccharolyticus]
MSGCLRYEGVPEQGGDFTMQRGSVDTHLDSVKERMSLLGTYSALV